MLDAHPNNDSNVDRLIATWQILHQNRGDDWFNGEDPRDEDQGTFAIKKRHHDDPEDPLRPFHNGDGKHWNSTGAREVTALGYTYPGLEKWKYTKPDGSYDTARHTSELKRTLNTD